MQGWSWWCPLHPWHHGAIPSHPPAPAGSAGSRTKLLREAKLSPLKIAQWNFPLKEDKKKGGEKKILILPDKGAVRRKGGNSPTEGARGDIGSFPSNSPKEARRAEPITGGQRDPTLFISILPFPAKGRDQIPSGWRLDTASRELLQNYSSRREMQGREPRTHRAPPKSCLDGEKGTSLLPSRGG